MNKDDKIVIDFLSLGGGVLVASTIQLLIYKGFEN